MPAAEAVSILQAVTEEAHRGLTAHPKTLSPWLFYDEAGSALFEKITELPEYYLTRTERAILEANATEILKAVGPNLTIAELGAGTATKTGILLRAATRLQKELLYQPIDVSPSALVEAQSLERSIPHLTVRPKVANYITDPIQIPPPSQPPHPRPYIGSSIGNFSPAEAREILTNLRRQLHPHDALLLGTDLAPSHTKSIATLISAYDDAQGVTAAFNRNILDRLNRDLAANFDPACFRHVARWNPDTPALNAPRIAWPTKRSTSPQISTCPALIYASLKGETIHTENSYKFTAPALQQLLEATGFTPTRTFYDENNLFAVTLASAV